MNPQLEVRHTIAAVRVDQRQHVIRCPAHDDQRASLSVGPGCDGGVLLKCHAGCPTETVLAAAGLTFNDLMRQRFDADDEARRVVATYDYTDERGELLYQVVRYAPKDFRQRRPSGAGWIWNLGSVRRVLFGLPALQHKQTVYIAEGEKDVLALRSREFAATTSAGGAGKWHDDYAQQLRGALIDHVVVIPDNDVAGFKHAESVAHSCLAAGLNVKVVKLPGLPAKGDVSDWFHDGHTSEELNALVSATRTYVAIEDGVSNRRHADSATVRPILVNLADVEPEQVAWLWNGRLAVGKLALLIGDPGLGKSWITLDVAARVSTGNAWPDDPHVSAPANVLILSAEDGLADTVRPRLDTLGADVRRIHHLAVLRAGDHERAVQLSDTTALEEAITQSGARVLIIDPISAYLGQTDSHRDSEVRGLIAPLAAVAGRTGVAILGVMHLAKSAQRPAIYRAVGSIAFAAAARIVLAVAADPDDATRRILAPIKSNLCAPPAALAYALADGRLAWDSAPVPDVDVDALLSGPAPDRQERREAESWLREALADGPVLARDIQRHSSQAGIASRTLWRAKKVLNIEADRYGYGREGKWFWRLGAPKQAPMTATDDGVAAYERDPENDSDSVGPTPKAATSDPVARNEE